jgi:DNA processing protein
VSDERSARVLLNLAAVTPLRGRRLAERFGGILEALDASEAEWAAVEGFTLSAAAAARAAVRAAADRLPAELDRLAAAGLKVAIPGDDGYPDGLRVLADPPLALTLRGDWTARDDFAVAIVGSRRPTPYGLAVAESLARDLAKAGVTVVSGLARGIDTAAHAAALKAGGRTVGILGSGLARFYPPENRSLADRMAASGAVISEFPLDMEPDRGNFPRRNRLISAMALGVVVAEADEVSGALITARLAAEQGREVFAVPGSVFSRMSRGPHRLLKQGARPAENVEDVLEGIEVFRGLLRRPPSADAAPGGDAAMPVEVTPEEGRVRSLLSLTPLGVDALSVRSGLPAARVSAALLGLELKGLVRPLPGNNYVLSERGAAATTV